MCISLYIFNVGMYISMYVYVYICIYMEREGIAQLDKFTVGMYKCIYIYICVYIIYKCIRI
jgi:hypothetical protein